MSKIIYTLFVLIYEKLIFKGFTTNPLSAGPLTYWTSRTTFNCVTDLNWFTHWGVLVFKLRPFGIDHKWCFTFLDGQTCMPSKRLSLHAIWIPRNNIIHRPLFQSTFFVNTFMIWCFTLHLYINFLFSFTIAINL